MLTYDDLLKIARDENKPQRILFVFTEIEQREDGKGNEGDFSIVPAFFIDKELHELSDFNALVESSKETGRHWDIVFVAVLMGENGQLPSFDQTDQQLDMMIKLINQGEISQFAAYKRSGEFAVLSKNS